MPKELNEDLKNPLCADLNNQDLMHVGLVNEEQLDKFIKKTVDENDQILKEEKATAKTSKAAVKEKPITHAVFE